MFNCERCENKLWTSYHKLPDGTIVCDSCYSVYLNQVLNKINDNQAYDILYNFVEKYQKKFSPDLLQELIRLLRLKYKITVDVVTLGEILNIIRSKIEKENNLKNLARFEKGLIKDSLEDISKVHLCEVCNVKIPKSEFDYSMANFDKPLCVTHQREKRASLHAQKLYYALKKRGIFCELESYGYKHIDISIRDAKLYIGVDGEHHSLDPEQLHVDLLRDEESQKKGFATKRYTLGEIDGNLEGIADTLAEVVEQRIKKYQKDEIFASKEINHNLSNTLGKRDKKRTTDNLKNGKRLNKLL